VLGAVKTEFGKFGDVLEKVKKQLNTASRTIDETGRRTRAMERKLRVVECLSDEEACEVLELPDDVEPDVIEITQPQLGEMSEQPET
jgi:DNA recombination protein RmuC